MVLFFVKKFNNLKLRKREHEEISKLIDLAHPYDPLVKDAFKKREILYKHYSDYTVTNNGHIEDCVQKILTTLNP